MTRQADVTAVPQELLKAGHARHADNVVSAALEQGPENTEAMLLKAMACLQASDMPIGRDTALALEAVKWARWDLHACSECLHNLCVLTVGGWFVAAGCCTVCAC